MGVMYGLLSDSINQLFLLCITGGKGTALSACVSVCALRVCAHVCAYVCACVCAHVCVHVCVPHVCVPMCVCMYCVHVCVCACVCVCFKLTCSSPTLRTAVSFPNHHCIASACLFEMLATWKQFRTFDQITS